MLTQIINFVSCSLLLDFNSVNNTLLCTYRCLAFSFGLGFLAGWHLGKEIVNSVRIVVRSDGIFRAEELFFRRDSRQHQETLESILGTEL